VKIRYLWSYLTKGKSGVASIMSLPKRGELMIVMSSNRQTGFLLGYQWASSEAVLQRLVRYNVVVNSPDVAVLAVV